jgi:hypothetical protein
VTGVPVVGYRIYVDNVFRASVRARSYVLRRLACDKGYAVAVSAYSATGESSVRRQRTVNTSHCSVAPEKRPATAIPPSVVSTCTHTTVPGADLPATIVAAAAGSVVCLTGGDYGAVIIRNVNKSRDTIVRSADGSSATIDLILRGSSHLRFDGLTIGRLQMGNNTDISFSHNMFTGMSLVETQVPSANILFDSNRFDGINAGPDDYEGRLTVRGYGQTQLAGVTISHNRFGGGCSDGVLVIGGARNVQIGPGNEFTEIIQSGCSEHVDPIQFYGADHTLVIGNYFHDNGDGSGGIMSPDGDDGAIVARNVFVCTCVYPHSIVASGADNWIVKHNTFIGGTVAFENSNRGEPPSGNVVRDNVWKGGGLSVLGDYGTNDHNLNSGEPGSGNRTGTPVFVGGRNPTTYAGYRLAARSAGKRAASDGTDMGIR